jgi:hypothetical protein
MTAAVMTVTPVRGESARAKPEARFPAPKVDFLGNGAGMNACKQEGMDR